MNDQAVPTGNCRTTGPSIDNIDAALVHLLAERFKITKARRPLQGDRLTSRRPTPNARRSRSPGCGHWPRNRVSTRCSRRSSSASSSPRSSITINASQRAKRSERRGRRRSGRDRRLDRVGQVRRGDGRRPLAGDIELVSVDSMQVYRGMDIGTAKPTPAERAEVPHHLHRPRRTDRATSPSPSSRWPCRRRSPTSTRPGASRSSSAAPASTTAP